MMSRLRKAARIRSRCGRHLILTCLFICSALCFTSTKVAAAISFVQQNYVETSSAQTPRASVAVAVAGAQTAGDFNVLIISWWNPLPPATLANIQSVVDSKGNTYTLAVGPTVDPDTTLLEAQAIYYAKNIGAATAGANVVTVTFDKAVDFPGIRMAEYSGIDKFTPFDVGIGTVGNGTTPTTGSITTTYANDLLVAGNVLEATNTAAGANYTSRAITTLDGNIIEDRIVTATGSYNATSVANGTGHWVMQVGAFRAADTTVPTTPAGLAATAASSAQINLSWTASTDNIAVTNYLIERCQGSGCTAFTQIASIAPGTTYSNTGLTAATSYSYRIRATDANGNNSAYSNTATATTSAVADTQAPTVPGSFAATAASSTQINLSWTASTDNIGVSGYDIERCQGVGCSTFALVTTVTTTSYNNTGLTASTSYSYRIRAKDAVPNFSAYTATATATTQASPDTVAPSTPTSLSPVVVSSTQINLTWSASTDNVAVTSYKVERCAGAGCSNFAQVTSIASTGFSDTGLSAATAYSYRVRAADAANNLSSYSNVVSASTSTASGASGSVTYGYDSLGRLVQAASPTLNTAQSYSYDAAGNISSSGVTALTTLSTTNFSANSGGPGTQITLYGSGFSTTPASNTVKFNGTPATVVSATATQLVVTVPVGALSGAVSVTVGSTTVSTPQSFAVTSASGAPTITSFSPTNGLPATVVTITGTNFKTSVTSNKVLFNDTVAELTAATATTLTVKVPTGASAGHIRVITPNGSATSTADFYILLAQFATNSLGQTTRTTENATSAASVSITAANQTALILFDGQQGDQYVRAAIQGSNTANIQVFDPLGNSIASGSAGTPIDLPTFKISGTYIIAISNGTSGANYSIWVLKAKVVNLDLSWASTNSTEDRGFQRTFFNFNGSQNEVIQLTFNTSVTQGSPVLSLIDQFGSTVWSVTVPAQPSILTLLPLPSSGTFSLVSDPGSTANPYLVFYAGVGASTLVADATATFLGIFPNANRTVVGRAMFQGAAGQTITFRATHSQNYSGISLPGSYVSMYYYSNAGASPTYLLASTTIQPDFSLQVKNLPLATTYYVEINPGGVSSPLNVQVLSAPGGTNALDASPVSVAISNPGQMSITTFTAPSSGYVGINLAPSGSPTIGWGQVTLIGPGANGSVVYTTNTTAQNTLLVNNAYALGPLNPGQYFMYVTSAKTMYNGTANVSYSMEQSPTTYGTLTATISSATTGSLTGSGIFAVSTSRLGQSARYAFSGSYFNSARTLKATNLSGCAAAVVLHLPGDSSTLSYSYLSQHSPTNASGYIIAGSGTTNITFSPGATGTYILEFEPADGCTLNLSNTLN